MAEKVKGKVIYESTKLPSQMLDLAIKLVEDKYGDKLTSYESYASAIAKEFSCDCTASDIIERFAGSIEMEDFRLIRKHCGYGY